MTVKGMIMIVVAVVSATQARAMPPDPQRPFMAASCPEARARLDEARGGSPLISDDENRQVLSRAEAQAERLCGPQGIHDLQR